MATPHERAATAARLVQSVAYSSDTLLQGWGMWNAAGWVACLSGSVAPAHAAYRVHVDAWFGDKGTRTAEVQAMVAQHRREVPSEYARKLDRVLAAYESADALAALVRTHLQRDIDDELGKLATAASTLAHDKRAAQQQGGVRELREVRIAFSAKCGQLGIDVEALACGRVKDSVLAAAATWVSEYTTAALARAGLSPELPHWCALCGVPRPHATHEYDLQLLLALAHRRSAGVADVAAQTAAAVVLLHTQQAVDVMLEGGLAGDLRAAMYRRARAGTLTHGSFRDAVTRAVTAHLAKCVGDAASAAVDVEALLQKMVDLPEGRAAVAGADARGSTYPHLPRSRAIARGRDGPPHGGCGGEGAAVLAMLRDARITPTAITSDGTDKDTRRSGPCVASQLHAARGGVREYHQAARDIQSRERRCVLGHATAWNSPAVYQGVLEPYYKTLLARLRDADETRRQYFQLLATSVEACAAQRHLARIAPAFDTTVLKQHGGPGLALLMQRAVEYQTPLRDGLPLSVDVMVGIVDMACLRCCIPPGCPGSPVTLSHGSRAGGPAGAHPSAGGRQQGGREGGAVQPSSAPDTAHTRVDAQPPRVSGCKRARDGVNGHADGEGGSGVPAPVPAGVPSADECSTPCAVEDGYEGCEAIALAMGGGRLLLQQQLDGRSRGARASEVYAIAGEVRVLLERGGDGLDAPPDTRLGTVDDLVARFAGAADRASGDAAGALWRFPFATVFLRHDAGVAAVTEGWRQWRMMRMLLSGTPRPRDTCIAPLDEAADAAIGPHPPGTRVHITRGPHGGGAGAGVGVAATVRASRPSPCLGFLYDVATIRGDLLTGVAGVFVTPMPPAGS